MRVCPDELMTAAQRLTTIQSDLGAANLMAAQSTTGIAAAAQDEVSESVASLFSAYGQQCNAAVEQVGVVGIQQFAQRLSAAADSYASTDAANAAALIPDQIGALLTQIAVAAAAIVFTPFFLSAALFYILAIFLHNAHLI